MANPFFQFKQFTVEQSEAALKVCTESCLFGAYIPVDRATRILDIGTGTGLLSLMVAQRSEATVEAIELDAPSCNDAAKNFERSPWKHRLRLHRGDVKTFSTDQPFDLIVCNPPFFIDQLKSPQDRTNAALHGSELKPSDLSVLVDKLSTENGLFFVLLPEKELEMLMENMKELGWNLFHRLDILQQESKPIFRTVGGFVKNKKSPAVVKERIAIYHSDRSYTKEFTALLKDYYLYL